VDVYLFITVVDAAAQGVFRHVAYGKDCCVGVLNVVNQMVLDTARFAHSIGGDYYQGAFMIVQGLGLVNTGGKMQVIKTKGIFMMFDKGIFYFFAVTFGVHLKNGGGVSRHG
jgi:hypothetical protein